MTATTVHHLTGDNDNATCGATPGFRKACGGHLVSIFVKDVTCYACLKKIKDFADRGFFPRY